MCPPGVDQTERSRQRWQLIAPRSRQLQKLSFNSDGMAIFRAAGPMQYLFQQDRVWDAWTKFARPVDTGFTNPAFPTTLRRQNLTQSSMTSALEKLPVEVMTMITENDELSKEDLVSLGLCSVYLWNLLMHHVEATTRSSAALWAGTEVICTGTYLRDLPATLEVQDIQALVGLPPVPGFRSNYMCTARRWNYAALRNFKHITISTEPDAWKSAFNTSQIGSVLDAGTQARLYDEIASIDAKLFPEGKWMLKNLTTKEFVRLHRREGLQDRRVEVVADYGEEGERIRLDDVVLSHICWTRESLSISKKFPVALNRGSWAGHSFEIVSTDHISLETEGWTDSTESICGWLASFREPGLVMDDQC